MAISVAVAVGDIGDALVDAIAARLPKLRIGDGADPDTDMGPLITARAPRQGRRLHRAPARQPARTVVVDGREADVPADGFFLGTTLLDHVTPEMTVYTDEIFGPVLCVVRARHLRRGARADQRQPVRQRHRDLHPRRRRGPPVPVRRRGRHGRHQRADPGAGRLLLLRRLEGLAVRRHPHVRPGGHQLLHPRQGRHLALARPGDLERRPRLPAGPADGHAIHDRPPGSPSIPTDEATVRAAGPGARLPLVVGAGADRPAADRARARARYFCDYDGNRYLDFSSQLVNVNIGYQHPKLVAAIQEQAGQAD